MRTALRVVLLTLVVASPAYAERLGYPPAEFAARRERLAKTLHEGTLLMFGATEPSPGVRFRQDNDFFYLTGNESLNAVLVMDAASGRSHLFMPRLTPAEVRYEGDNWLGQRDAAATHGLASIQPLTDLHEFLARARRSSAKATLWIRLSDRDEVNYGRDDTALNTARRLTNPFAQHPSEDTFRVQAIRQLFPGHEIRDVTPALDRLRLIKTDREIEILRYNGRISAEALKRAIAATAPGRFEYELEAEATHWLIAHGLQSAAYPAIVGSGPNGNQWHYENNGRQTRAGDLVVMDYGGSLDYLTVDITRTWPVSGSFSDRQLKAYECVLEAQEAMIAAIRPGVTRQAVRTRGEEVYRKHGFDPRYAYVGHYVGLSVHDVGDWELPFEAGMVLAIEPIIDLPEEQLHIRIEDTVLVTAGGAEVLSADVPKDVRDVLALIRR